LSPGRFSRTESLTEATAGNHRVLQRGQRFVLEGRVWQAWLLALVVLASGVGIGFRDVAPGHPFTYDEADYMYAGAQGFWDNFLDRPSISFREFVSKGLELSRRPDLRGGFSRYIRASGDITFYRHFHGPLYSEWLVLCHALGVDEESAFRASGLWIHLATTILIFFGFRLVFSSLPSAGAFVAAAAFLMNRTALVTSLAITQHVLFIFLATLTLLCAARFCRDLNLNYWYAAVASLALAFSTVEISALLAAALLITLLALRKRLRERCTWLGLAWRSAGVFLLALLAVWPMGLLKLGMLKGYLYLAYMTLYRKTFVEGGPLELWAAKFRTAPLEFLLAACALLACLAWWRKLAHRRELTPVAAYIVIFLATTLVITIPFTHYHGSLMAACAIVTGVMAGEVWRRSGAALRIVALAAVMASLYGMAQAYYQEARRERDRQPLSVGVLDYIATRQEIPGKMWYVPFTLVPTLHYYHPGLETTGYDAGWASESLAAELGSAKTPVEALCEPARCDELAQALERYGPVRRELAASNPEGRMYSLTLGNRQAEP